MVMWNWGLINGAANAKDDAALHTLSFVGFFGFAGKGIGITTTFLATGLAGIAHAVLPRWFAILTVVLGVLSALGTAGVPPGGLVNYLLLPFSVFAAMRAGACGYLLKGAEQEEIVRAIRAAAAGEAIFGPEIARRVIGHLASGAGSTVGAFPSLTDREREVLELVAAGKGNATIAHELMISLKTVRNHVSNIFAKLQISDRSAAIVKAREAGMGRPEGGLSADRGFVTRSSARDRRRFAWREVETVVRHPQQSGGNAQHGDP